MIVYLTAFIVLLIPVFRFDLMKLEGNKTLWMYAEYIILVLIAGLRYRVGGDTLAYMDLFRDYPTISELGTFDFEEAKYNPMWYIYNSVFKTLGDSFTLFQICNAALANWAFFRFFKRYSPSACFSCIFLYFWGYYFYFNMEILREVLCIAVFLEAYPFLEKKKYLTYYLLCLFALSIHMSAVLIFLFPLAHIVKKDYFWLSILIVAGVVWAMGVIDIIDIILSIAFEGHLAVTVRGYMASQMPNALGATMIFIKAVPFMVFMFVRNKHGFTEDMLMGKILFFLVFIQCLGIFVPVIPRFSNYIYPLGIVYLANTFYCHYWEIRSRLLSSVLVTGALLLYGANLTHFYIINREDDLKGAHVYNRYVPYYSVFNPRMDKTREMLLMNERANEVLPDGK